MGGVTIAAQATAEFSLPIVVTPRGPADLGAILDQAAPEHQAAHAGNAVARYIKALFGETRGTRMLTKTKAVMFEGVCLVWDAIERGDIDATTGKGLRVKPFLSELKAKTGCSIPTIRKALRELHERGLIRDLEIKHGAGHANVIEIGDAMRVNAELKVLLSNKPAKIAYV
jgi:hypothetical protein